MHCRGALTRLCKHNEEEEKLDMLWSLDGTLCLELSAFAHGKIEREGKGEREWMCTNYSGCF